MPDQTENFLLAVIAIIFPPAAVAFITGCSGDLCLNILLTILGWLPGCIHAFWLIFKRSEANSTYGSKNWIYEGSGHYRPGPQPTPAAQQPYTPPPPPPAQQPGGTAGYYAPPPPPQTQAPADQKQAGYRAPPQQPPTNDEKSGGYTAPPKGSPEQQQQQAQGVPPPPPGDQKA